MKKNRDIDKFNGEELVEMAIALEELASNDYDNWEYGQAAKTYQIIIEFYERAGDSTKVAELMKKKELALRALAEEGRVHETIEDIEVLDKLADDAYDSKEYETAASFYREILHIICNGDDVKQIADYYYLYGICLCQAEKYDEGIKSLEISYNLEKKINGGVSSKTTRATMEEICDYSFEQNCSHSSYYQNLAKLFKEYESLKEFDCIEAYSKTIISLYHTFINALPNKDTVFTTGTEQRWIKIGHNYSDRNLGLNALPALCTYFTVTREENVLLNISELYINRYEELFDNLVNYRLHNTDADIYADGIFCKFMINAEIICNSLIQMNLYSKCHEFCSKTIEIVKRLTGIIVDIKRVHCEVLSCSNDNGYHEYYITNTGEIFRNVHFINSICLSKIGEKVKGKHTLSTCGDEFINCVTDDSLSDEDKTIIVNQKNATIRAIKLKVGLYYLNNSIGNFKKAKEYIEESVEMGLFEGIKELTYIYNVLGLSADSLEKLYVNIITECENSNDIDYFVNKDNKDTVVYCKEQLANSYKERQHYSKALKLYSQLIADATDVFERERFKKERYRCMAYAEVDTIEVLQEVERYFAQRTILESQESLETIQDINALAYGYISYANHLADENEAEAQKYFRKGKDTYQNFFSLSEDLLEEAIRNENRRDIFAHIKEYDRTLQHYLELINKSNISEMFDCVAKYQSFAFEVDRLLSQKNGNAFKRNNVAKQLQAHLDDSVCILNYVLFYEKDIRRYGVFVLQKQKPLMFYKLGNEEKINDAILSFKECITDPASDIEEFNRIKLVLQNELLSQIELDDVERVYVVRAHGLEGIPFHSLLDIKTSELVSTMSYLTNYDEEDPDYNQIVIFSNPQFEVDNYGTRTTRYQILEGSRIEGNLIRRIYPENQTTSYEGINANVNELARALQENEAGVFHISSHHVKSYSEANGYMDSSKLILAGANNLTEDEAFIDTFGKDGTISAAEISRINMSRKLVVLAACKTGGGDVVEGGGLYGLSRAFYQHGCKVISTLYDVGDYPTAVFFKFFYESLRDVGDVENAIIKARLKMQRVKKGQLANIIQELPDGGKRGTEKRRYINQIRMTPREYPYSPPYYWAGYIIGGR